MLVQTGSLHRRLRGLRGLRGCRMGLASVTRAPLLH